MSECQRCGSDLTNRLCEDQTCPFSDHLQGCMVGWIGHSDWNIPESVKCQCRALRPKKSGKSGKTDAEIWAGLGHVSLMVLAFATVAAVAVRLFWCIVTGLPTELWFQ